MTSILDLVQSDTAKVSEVTAPDTTDTVSTASASAGAGVGEPESESESNTEDGEVSASAPTPKPKTKAKASDNASRLKKSDTANAKDEFRCRWVDCPDPNQDSMLALVVHLNNVHLAYLTTMPSYLQHHFKYTCQWEGCTRFGVDQPSRFALLSHCRTHTGEKPYFCPIPECEKHFTRSDALAKHVKAVHDLHPTKDALVLIKDRAKKNKLESHIDNASELTEEAYIDLTNKLYALRQPWWNSTTFLDTLRDPVEKEKYTIGDLVTTLPFDTKQHEAAHFRYKAFVESDLELLVHQSSENPVSGAIEERMREKAAAARSALAEDDLELDIDEMEDLEDLKSLHDRLNKRLAVSIKVNLMLQDGLAQRVRKRRRLWVANQVLLESNVALGLPVKKAEKGKLGLDQYDEAIINGV